MGSVGPYGASLHDGSEYTGSYAKYTTAEHMKNWHIPRIKALIEGGVDMLALETIPCKVEAEMLVQLLKEFPSMKAWLCFSVSVSIVKVVGFPRAISISISRRQVPSQCINELKCLTIWQPLSGIQSYTYIS